MSRNVLAVGKTGYAQQRNQFQDVPEYVLVLLSSSLAITLTFLLPLSHVFYYIFGLFFFLGGFY